MLESSKRDLKIGKAANTATVHNRYVHNQGISQGVNDFLDSKGKHKTGKFYNQPSSKLQTVFSRVVINSSKNLGITKNIEHKKVVVKGISNRKTKVAKEGDGARDTVKCLN